MRAESKEANGEEEALAEADRDGEEDDYASDIDICDFDVDQVDDSLFDIAESPKKEKRKRTSARTVSKHNVSNGGAGASEDGSAKPTQSKENTKLRYDSTSSQQSDRIWEEKFLQDSQTPLFQIDSLVVVNDTPLPPASPNESAALPKTRAAAKLLSKPAEASTSATVSSYSSAASVSRGRKKPGNKTASKAPSAISNSSRPRMIHTERARVVKSSVGTESSSKKTRSKVYVTRTETTSNLGTLEKSCIVDDYEIISPATQPPNQISSSPLHIKQEQEHQQQRVQLMYDDNLLIDAALLREKTYEKFNPSIVNDLEEILRSPLKHDRSSRLRFTSESSTTPQFLPEEEQHLIKIEPTSPDLREMVESQQRVTSSSSSSARTSRHLRQITANGPRAGSRRFAEKSSPGAGVANKKATSSASTVSKVGSSSSYLGYGVEAYSVNQCVPASGSTGDVGSGFFSISEVVSAADAADAAAKAAAAGKSERKTRFFECEMCTAIFYDRAQLLEHVHIHI